MTQIKLRIPPDIKAWLEAEARRNGSSQNSEVIRCIRERMKAIGPVETAISPGLDHGNPMQGKTNELSTQ